MKLKHDEPGRLSEEYDSDFVQSALFIVGFVSGLLIGLMIGAILL